MARLHIVVLCLIFASTISFMECSIEAFNSNYQVAQSEADLLSDNLETNWQPLIKQEKFDEKSQRYQLLYQFGQRIDGDYLLARDYGKKNWSTLHDYKLNLDFPKSGTSAYAISYFEVIVDQSSHLGKAQIVSGGIGAKQMSVTVEANQTYHFEHEAAIYGY